MPLDKVYIPKHLHLPHGFSEVIIIQPKGKGNDHQP